MAELDLHRTLNWAAGLTPRLNFPAASELLLLLLEPSQGLAFLGYVEEKCKAAAAIPKIESGFHNLVASSQQTFQ